MAGAEIHDFTAVRGPDAQPAFAELWRSLRGAPDLTEFAGHWLELQSGILTGARAGIVVLGPGETGPFAPVATRPANLAVGTELSLAAEAALADRKGVIRETVGSLCLAYPVMLDDALHGVVAFELSPRAKPEALQAARQLQWGLAWIESAIRRGSLLPNRALADVMDIVAILMESPSLRIGLNAAMGDLARCVGAEWATVALVRDGAVKEASALTLSFQPSRSAAIVKAIGSAMQEAMDQRAEIVDPAPAGAPPLVRRAHGALRETAAAGSVFSCLMPCAGEAVGVITLAGKAVDSLGPQAAATVRLAAAMLGPAVELKRRDDRWIGGKLWDWGIGWAKRLAGPSDIGWKLAGTAVVLALMAVSVAETTYRVTAPVLLEGASQRVLTSPIQGYIAASLARAGDLVASGDVIARLDDKDLRAERARWNAEREKAAREHQRGLADGDRMRVQVQRAQIDQAQARLDLIDENLTRIEIRAPFDGVIVRGDLSQSQGAPVQRGEALFEIAPRDAYRAVLKVDERDIALLREGQSASVVLSSFPDRSIAVTVARITPVSAVEEGRNLFRVEGRITETPPELRPGMQGTAKIEVGSRPLYEALTVRPRQWLTLVWWRWRP